MRQLQRQRVTSSGGSAGDCHHNDGTRFAIEQLVAQHQYRTTSGLFSTPNRVQISPNYVTSQ